MVPIDTATIATKSANHAKSVKIKNPAPQQRNARLKRIGALSNPMSVTQATRLLGWVIAGLILLGILLYFFGPKR